MSLDLSKCLARLNAMQTPSRLQLHETRCVAIQQSSGLWGSLPISSSLSYDLKGQELKRTEMSQLGYLLHGAEDLCSIPMAFVKRIRCLHSRCRRSTYASETVVLQQEYALETAAVGNGPPSVMVPRDTIVYGQQMSSLSCGWTLASVSSRLTGIRCSNEQSAECRPTRARWSCPAFLQGLMPDNSLLDRALCACCSTIQPSLREVVGEPAAMQVMLSTREKQLMFCVPVQVHCLRVACLKPRG